MSLLAPALLAGLASLAIPVIIHLVQRERRRVLPFPSLMFLRRIPYQSVRRRRIRDWPLLLLRLAAVLLVVLAFTRPFFARGAIASAAARGGREVVVLLDRSASMGYGDHWSRAQAAARAAVGRLGSADRATLVLFDSTAEESVRSTGDRARLQQAIAQARPGSGATRYAPALKLAMSILARSPLPGREAVLVSDFQKTGWRGSEDVRFPEGTVLTPAAITSPDPRNLSVTSVSIARASFAGKERLTVTAALRNGGAAAAAGVPVSLQVGDDIVETLPATVPAGASTTVTFAPFTLATPGMPAIVRAGTDAMPADNVFRVVLAPSAAVGVLLVDPERESESSLYLRNALAIGASPSFVVDDMPLSRITPAALEHHAVVVLNGVPASRIGSAAIRQFVERGGGLLMLLGGDAAPGAASESDGLPAAVDDNRSESGATTIGYVDFSHPAFEIFQAAHGGDFSSARVYRYRKLTAGTGDRVLARFSDGGVAAVERRLGAGRVIAWSSTLDDSWNDLALKPVFLPFVQQVVRYLARYEPETPWQTVGQALDLSGSAARLSSARQSAAPVAGRLVLTPSGKRIEAAADGGPLRFVDLDEQGFYEVRTPAAPPVRVAVNLDPTESDLSPIDPQELVATVTGHAQQPTAGGARPLTAEELERRQSIWWYLLFAGLLLFAVETVLSNRVSAARGSSVARRSAPGDRPSIADPRGVMTGS